MVSHINQRWTQTWLSTPSRIDGAFVLGYRITGGGPNVRNAWSERFNRFKFGPLRSQHAGIAVIRTTMGSLTNYSNLNRMSSSCQWRTCGSSSSQPSPDVSRKHTRTAVEGLTPQDNAQFHDDMIESQPDGNSRGGCRP